MGGIGPVIDPERIIVNVSGVVDWRPQFVRGLQAAFVLAFVTGFAIALFVWYGRR